MTKKFRVLETLDEWGECIWKVEETTTFRPWWRKVHSYYDKDKAFRALRILTNPKKDAIEEKSTLITWIGLTDKERAQFVIGGAQFRIVKAIESKLKEKNT